MERSFEFDIGKTIEYSKNIPEKSSLSIDMYFVGIKDKKMYCASFLIRKDEVCESTILIALKEIIKKANKKGGIEKGDNVVFHIGHFDPKEKEELN